MKWLENVILITDESFFIIHSKKLPLNYRLKSLHDDSDHYEFTYLSASILPMFIE